MHDDKEKHEQFRNFLLYQMKEAKEALDDPETAYEEIEYVEGRRTAFAEAYGAFLVAFPRENV